MIIHNASYTDLVEIGYYEDSSYYGCLVNTSGKPRVMAYEINSTGTSCDQTVPELDGGTVVTFSVGDANQDGYWTFQYDGNDVFTSAESMGLFTSGIINANGERGSSDDSARANFRGLKRLNSSGSWVNWDDTSKNNSESDDPGYKGCKYSNVHTAVIQNSGTC